MKLRVTGQFERCKPTEATVEIGRNAIVKVRPLRSRQVYAMRLVDLAEIVVSRGMGAGIPARRR